jgi:hypothetical protein
MVTKLGAYRGLLTPIEPNRSNPCLAMLAWIAVEMAPKRRTP